MNVKSLFKYSHKFSINVALSWVEIFLPRMMSFQYFEAEQHATVYNKSRPSPPSQLIETIVKYLLEKHPKPLGEALDIGCGSGQSTEVLAPFFKKVTGIDPSQKQICEAQKKNILPNVYYKVGYAENIDYSDGSAQLITASQACHWFDLPKFYKEVERILVPQGILALYGYFLPKPLYKDKTEELGCAVDKYYNISLGKYVPPESKKVYIENYKGDDFMNVPFVTEPVIRIESVSSENTGTVGDLVDFFQSGSAYQNFLKHEGEEKAASLLKGFEKEIMNIIGSSSSPDDIPIQIQYKYFLLIAKKPA